jgi:ABC-type nitrate/sulfonate/bicarbonate transport system substrate-binding protein
VNVSSRRPWAAVFGIADVVAGTVAEARRQRRVSLLVCIVLCFILFAGCEHGPERAESSGRKQITIDVSPSLGSAALYIAHEKGYFKDEGLEAALQTHASGRLSLQAVLAGEADFAAVAETPIASAAVDGKAFAVVATISEIERAMLIVSSKDRGISQAVDLKGKRIGVAPGTTGDFFLHIYLTTSYVNPKEVRIVDLPSEEVVNALLTGKVDAVSTWSPQTIELQDKLGGNAAVLDEPGLYSLTWNLVVRTDFTRSDPDAIVRVLRAVVRANRFIAEQPDEARAVTARNIGADVAAVEREWADCKSLAVLTQSLILQLEDQARWMLKRDSVGKEVPNFLDFIHTKGLKTVAPDAVQIVERQE